MYACSLYANPSHSFLSAEYCVQFTREFQLAIWRAVYTRIPPIHFYRQNIACSLHANSNSLFGVQFICESLPFISIGRILRAVYTRIPPIQFSIGRILRAVYMRIPSHSTRLYHTQNFINSLSIIRHHPDSEASKCTF